MRSANKIEMVIFDIDGTLTTHVSSWRFIHEKLGIWDALAEKYQEQFFAGKIDYEEFCRLDAEHWQGMKKQKITFAFKKVQYSKNTQKAINLLKENKIKLIAVSTGLQFITDKIKKELKFDYVLGNRLQVYDGKLTGKVKINIGHGEKGKIVKRIAKKYKISLKKIACVGDTEGDIPMFKECGYSIAFNSSSKNVKKEADYTCKTTDLMEVAEKILDIK